MIAHATRVTRPDRGIARAEPDRGKPPMSLHPGNSLLKIAAAMDAGNRANGYAPGSWRSVDPVKFWDALGRHYAAALDDPTAIDDESGVTHLALLGANLHFLLALGFDESGDA